MPQLTWASDTWAQSQRPRLRSGRMLSGKVPGEKTRTRSQGCVYDVNGAVRCRPKDRVAASLVLWDEAIWEGLAADGGMIQERGNADGRTLTI